MRQREELVAPCREHCSDRDADVHHDDKESSKAADCCKRDAHALVLAEVGLKEFLHAVPLGLKRLVALVDGEVVVGYYLGVSPGLAGLEIVAEAFLARQQQRHHHDAGDDEQRPRQDVAGTVFAMVVLGHNDAAEVLLSVSGANLRKNEFPCSHYPAKSEYKPVCRPCGHASEDCGAPSPGGAAGCGAQETDAEPDEMLCCGSGEGDSEASQV